ncbi:MAG: hypothetical protein IJF26_01740 [Clostridia bacterium]|nr:hypothetical protein [Clostridia bacterium]
MITFLKKRSYDLVYMFITQLAISIFGLALAFAIPENRPGLMIGTSVFSVCFYLFLIYTRVWELGYKDSNSFAKGVDGLSRLEGLYMGLAANTVNFLVALLILIGWLSSNGVIDAIAGGATVVALLTEGMYIGILSASVGGVTLNSLGFMYLIITLPMILTSTLAYLAGSHDFKLFGAKKN